MKALVKVLSYDNFNKKGLSILNLRENLKILCELQDKMNLQQYKDAFTKPLSVDINLGLAIFQLLKNFSHKNEQFITKSDLLMLLESYFEPEQQNKDLNSLVLNLETSSCTLSNCFDNIKYSNKAVVTSLDLLSLLQRFYPSFARSILSSLITQLDSNKMGIIYYDHLQSFLMEYSKRDNFCLSLEVKKIASLLEDKGSLFDYYEKV
jgi:hypothetical protein